MYYLFDLPVSHSIFIPTMPSKKKKERIDKEQMDKLYDAITQLTENLNARQTTSEVHLEDNPESKDDGEACQARYPWKLRKLWKILNQLRAEKGERLGVKMSCVVENLPKRPKLVSPMTLILMSSDESDSDDEIDFDIPLFGSTLGNSVPKNIKTM